MHQWRAASAMHAFEQLTAFGWRIPVRTYRRIVRAATVLALVCMAGASALVFDVLRAGVLPGGRPNTHGGLLLVAYLAGCGYVLAVGVVRELVTRRRDVVAASVHTAFFRALDIPATTVFAVWAGAAIVRTSAVWVVLAVSYVTAFHAELTGVISAPAALLGIPVAVGAVQLALAANAAAAPTRVARARRRWVGLAATLVVLVVAGRDLSEVVASGWGGEQLAWAWSPATTTTVVIGGSIVTASVAAWLVAIGWVV